jgi:putative ABC transport system ATP-binding protein
MQLSNHTEFIVYMEALGKVYQLGDEKIEVLKDITLSIPKGKFIALCGASGSGKTTLLNIIGGIDRLTAAKFL